MNNKLKQFISGADKLSLTKEEKSSMRSALVNYIRLNSATNQVFYRHGISTQPWFLTFFNSRLAPVALSFLVLLSMGGGVSFAAEKSLPGNVLYPLKVYVLEEGRAMLALTPEEKAVWASERMSLRLREAAILASRGELDSEVAVEIENNFELQAENFAEHTNQLEDDGYIEEAAELNSNLEATLSVHANILKSFARGSNNQNSNEAMDNLALNIDAQKDNKTFARLHMEERISNSSQNIARQAAERRLKEAENKIIRLKADFEELKPLLNAEIISKIEFKLTLAEKILAEGKVKLESDLYGEAFILFGQVHRIAQETKLFMDANKEFEIDILLDAEIDEDTEDENGTEIEDIEDDNSIGDEENNTSKQEEEDSEKNEQTEKEGTRFNIDFDLRDRLGL